MRIQLFILSGLFAFSALAQTNIRVTNAAADKVLKGQYDPADYEASSQESDHHEIICGLRHRISEDSLRSYIERLEGFHTRHTYSDTLSNDSGIGAARRWAFEKFRSFSSENENRLLASYLEFDYANGSCGDGYGWRNVLAVLPGTDQSDHKLIILEAHMDSRCAVGCDSMCYAPGAEDNASGTALVIELARVLSRYTFKKTIVFMLTIGEEEGLYGAEAMATYCSDNSIPIRAVLNNDIVGAVVCGKTASPPGCPYEGHLDSTHVRLFSYGSLALQHRGLARTIKLYNDEKLNGIMAVPMEVDIMNMEDRTGRGGDHIPFRMAGFTSIRFTSANEHGDANPGPGYTDRQHTSSDVMGLDTNSDGTLDVLFVNFPYLKRNSIINGATAVLLALGPATPAFTVHDEPTGLRVEILNPGNESFYRIGVRSSNLVHTFDAIYRTTSTSFLIPGLEAGETYFISVASVDSNQITSIFSAEQFKGNDANTASADEDGLDLNVDCSLVGVNPAYHAPQKLLVFPNPTNSVLQFQFPYEGSYSLHVVSMDGRCVMDDRIHSSDPSVDLDLEDGWYFMDLVHESGAVFHVKVLIIHD